MHGAMPWHFEPRGYPMAAIARTIPSLTGVAENGSMKYSELDLSPILFCSDPVPVATCYRSRVLEIMREPVERRDSVERLRSVYHSAIRIPMPIAESARPRNDVHPPAGRVVQQQEASP